MNKHLFLSLTFFLVWRLFCQPCVPKSDLERALPESVYPAGADALTAYPATTHGSAEILPTTEIPGSQLPRAFRCFHPDIPDGQAELPTGTRPRLPYGRRPDLDRCQPRGCHFSQRRLL